MAKSTKALINKTVQKIRRRTRAVMVDKNSNLPTYDCGYSQAREFSQHRNGWHCIYKALHALNLLYGRPVSWPEVADLLASAPSCGGYAFFIKRSTIKRYMFGNAFGLWRKLDRVQDAGNGLPRALFVASGLTATGQKRADSSRNRNRKLAAVMVW
jgi:hypothetical protein